MISIDFVRITLKRLLISTVVVQFISGVVNFVLPMGPTNFGNPTAYETIIALFEVTWGAQCPFQSLRTLAK